MPSPHVPEVQLHLADEAHALWQKTEEQLGEMGLEPPFWAFAWAGGQGLARYIIDHPEMVRGRSVFDFATGSGVVAIAAAKAGAARVLANDIDPMCEPAVALNAAANDCHVEYTADIMVGDDLSKFDIVLAGDVFFDREMSAMIAPWFDDLAAAGKTVLLGDPGRHYLPGGLEKLASYTVTVARALEDAEVKNTAVYRYPA
ncbi:MAG: 50S ribosomal protein L11 methyltransferase [Pseudomonadota bacterium]